MPVHNRSTNPAAVIRKPLTVPPQRCGAHRPPMRCWSPLVPRRVTPWCRTHGSRLSCSQGPTPNRLDVHIIRARELIAKVSRALVVLCARSVVAAYGRSLMGGRCSPAAGTARRAVGHMQDFNLHGKGTSDPYVFVSVRDQHVRSRTIVKNLNPVSERAPHRAHLRRPPAVVPFAPAIRCAVLVRPLTD